MNYGVRLLSIVGCLLWYSGCRDIQTFESDVPIVGYQLNGKVTTPNGTSVESVSVVLFYRYEYLQPNPLDTITVYIYDSLKNVYVGVYNIDGRYVRRLFLDFLSIGPLPRFHWDERDDGGKTVSSGKYFIRYEYNDTVRKIVPYLADGNTSAITDRKGEFVLTNRFFPIGEAFDFYRCNGTFDGVFRVRAMVVLNFKKGSLSSTYEIRMQKDKITRGIFTLP